MGQRLNIEIKRKKDNKVLANAYYHWSAYTEPSLNLAKDILGNVWTTFRLYKEKNDTLKAIQLLQCTGAGLIEEDYDTLSNEDKKYTRVCENRNAGLISITEKGMNETRQWEEGRVTITIDFDKESGGDNTIDFEVCYPVEEEEIKEYYPIELKSGEIDLKNVVELDFDLQNMKCVDIETFLGKLHLIEDNFGLFKNNGRLYQIIY